MANYYTQFSFELNDLTEAELAWLHALLDSEDGEPTAEMREMLADPDHLNFEFEFQGDTLWIHSGESGIPENAANLVQAFLAEHRPDDTFGFEVAHSCSRPISDSFGGAAVYITANEQRWNSTSHWLANRFSSELPTDDELDAVLDGRYVGLDHPSATWRPGWPKLVITGVRHDETMGGDPRLEMEFTLDGSEFRIGEYEGPNAFDADGQNMHAYEIPPIFGIEADSEESDAMVSALEAMRQVYEWNIERLADPATRRAVVVAAERMTRLIAGEEQE